MKLWKQLMLSKTSLMGDNKGYCFKFELFGRSQNLHVFSVYFLNSIVNKVLLPEDEPVYEILRHIFLTLTTQNS